MRYAFIITIIALLQLFSVGAALSLQWWLQPWLTSQSASTTTAVWVIVFVITNLLLILSVSKLFANSYRWISGWMLIMHFMMLTALSTSLLYGGYWALSALFDNIIFSSAINHSEMVAIGLRIFALIFFRTIRLRLI